MDWSPQQIAELTRLWDEGVKTGEIGRRLGVTKSAAVGKAHRLKLSPRESPIKYARAPAKSMARPMLRHQKPKPSDPVRPVVRVKPPVTLNNDERRARAGAWADRETVKGSCQWPIGHPDEPGFHFCAATRVVEGKPYCADHCAVAFVRLPDRRLRSLEQDGPADPLNVDHGRGVGTAPDQAA